MAMGVANPNEQGQAINNTAIALLKALPKPTPTDSQARNVKVDTTITEGTKTAEMRSTVFWMGNLDDWA
jgi:hypothetical protein